MTLKFTMKDFSQNSHFHPEFIASPVDKSVFSGWIWSYLLLSENADPKRITSGFKDFYAAHIEVNPGQIKNEAYLQNISYIHLHSNKQKEIETNSNIYVIYTLATASLILLITGLSNYANLNMGMAGFGEKYLFVSRISGSTSLMTIKYFLTEGILIIVASFLFGSVFLVFSDKLIQKYISMDLFTGNTVLISAVAFLFSISGILSAILPLMNQGISNLRTSTQFKNNIWTGRKGLSKSIIVLQFAISTTLIIAVLVIHRQTSFALESGMGFKEDNLICFREVHSDAQKKFEVFKEELLKFSSIEQVSAMFHLPEEKQMIFFNSQWKVISQIRQTGLKVTSAMKRLNYTDPDEIVGKEFDLITNIQGIEVPAGKITGVVKDFHLSGVKREVEPLVMFKRNDLWLINFVASYRSDMKANALNDIESIWKKMFPGYPFQYEYVSSMYKSVYRSEILQSGLLAIFTLISLFICSMGLLGMTLLSTQKRTKEIGLRKINGASTGELMIMLNWDLVRWIMIAFVIAVPVAVVAMNKWLENFAYKIDLKWWIIVLAGLITMLIALLTVSLQSWKAANRNPVEALRYE
jgi:putative ABC transport system permease protein